MNAKPNKYPMGIGTALLAAILFGLSTPLAKLLISDIEPVLLAGLLYAGSGIGLSLWLGIRRLFKQASNEAPLRRADIPWLSAAVFFGGVLGPVLLMIGLVTTPASTASLMLNLEGVLTALLAWLVFKENVDRRIFLGMLAIIAGGVLLSRQRDAVSGIPWGSLAIAGACACWAIDNNFTRVVSGGDPVQIAAIKGGVAGIINIAIALLLGNRLPEVSQIAA
ncbi:MAG TPA: DMT family transporter, partial [Arenimonas sp.]|nr:DMT family transporter [Arenimonas sp.]